MLDLHGYYYNMCQMYECVECIPKQYNPPTKKEIIRKQFVDYKSQISQLKKVNEEYLKYIILKETFLPDVLVDIIHVYCG